MIETPVSIKLTKKLDVRPMALLVNEASRYDSLVYIKVENKTVNAKSIMGVMSLNFNQDQEIVIVTDGVDEEKAADGIKAFLATL
jgi:phosphotransferase system HPr (HPr) family protein